MDGLLLSNEHQADLVAWAKERSPQWELRFSDEKSSYFVRR